MVKFLKRISWLKLAVYILPLCYLFVTLFSSIFSNSGNMQARAIFLTVWLLACFLISDKRKLGQPVISAFLFCIYTFIVFILISSNNDTNFWEALSCIFVWPIALYNSMHIKLKPIDIEVCAIIIGICCNIMAFTWYNGIQSYYGSNAVAAANAVYYILIALLYIFLIRNTLIKLILIPYPLFVLLNSNKSTCVILAVALTTYYLYKKVKSTRLIYKLGILTLVFILLSFGLQLFDYDSISRSVSGDFDNGGSGRLDIWSMAISAILSSPDFSLLFGHGYGATAAILNIGAHNDIIEIIINFGIIGLLLYSIFCYHLLSCIKQITIQNDYRLIYVMSIIVFIVMTMVSKLVGTQIQFLLFTTIWGVLFNQTKAVRE